MAVRQLSDAELITAARKGDSDAYGELYRRHVDSARAAARALTRSRSDADDVTSEAFARVLRALQSGGGPEVSFRPYLVTAVRNVFYDRVRRNREDPSEDLNDEVNVALLDAAKSQEDGAFATAAFATLPERWQLVLWHTEVEGRSVSEVAPLLGLAPNAVAALAYRAREGLRQAYLQAHLREQNQLECRECAANLGAYVRDGLSARDRRRVDAHLDGCASCTALVAELADTNNTLRAALIPALVGVSATAYLSGLGGKGLLAWFTRMPKRNQVATGGAAAAAVVLVLALIANAAGGADKSAAPAASTTVPATQPGGGDDGSGNTSPPVTAPPPPTNTTVPPPSTVPVPTSITSPIVPVTTPRTYPTTPTTIRPPRTTVPHTTVPHTTVPQTTVPHPTTTLPNTTTTAPPPPVLSAVASQLSTAVSNGQVRVQVVVSNNGTSAASGVQLDVPVPSGATFLHAEGLHASAAPVATFVRAFAPGWSCSAPASTLSCTLPSLPGGQTSTVVLVFAISPSSPSSITLTPGISHPVGATVSITPVTIPVSVLSGVLAAETERGTVLAIGNSVTTCDDASPGCASARDGSGTGTVLDHNSHLMQYVNTAGGTFDSSSARLVLTGTVSRAFLVWAGDVAQNSSVAPNAAARNTVSFTTPSGTSTVTADRIVDNSGSTYFAAAEVTSLMGGSGTYSVADIQTALDVATFGGWSLVIIEHDASMPERFLLAADPLVVMSGTPYTLNVDLLTPMSNATGTLVAVGFEGDRSLPGDNVGLSGYSVTNPFHGEVPGTRNPSYDNCLGTDVFVDAVTGMNGSQLAFSAATSGDRVMLGIVAIALDL